MRVFVTGASGFFGSSLVPKLIELGHEVTTYGRSKDVPAFAALNNWRHVQGDISDVPKMTEAMDGADILFHMAGLVSYQKADYERLYEANVIGSRNVLQAAVAVKVGRVIHLGSIAGMGIPEPGSVGTEELEYNLGGRGLHYCDTKHESDLEVLKFASQIPVIILSPGITFGEGDNHPHHHTIFNSMAKGGLVGFPRGGVTFSDIKDVVQACVNAMTMGRPGQKYVIGSANMTFQNAANTVSKIVGSKAPGFAIPGQISELAGAACEAVFPILGLKPVLTWQVAWLSQRNIFFSSEKAMLELGLTQTSFEDTIRRTAPFYLSGAKAQNDKAASASVR